MKKKLKIIRFIFLGLVLVGGIIGFFIVNYKIDKRRLASFKVIKNKNRYEIGFDGFEKENGKLILNGWCFKKDITRAFDLNQNITVQVVLRNKKDKMDILFLDTKRCQRDELDEMFPSEVTRKYDGFTADVKLGKLDLDSKDYNISMNHVSVALRRKSLMKVGGYITFPLIEDYYL